MAACRQEATSNIETFDFLFSSSLFACLFILYKYQLLRVIVQLRTYEHNKRDNRTKTTSASMAT